MSANPRRGSLVMCINRPVTPELTGGLREISDWALPCHLKTNPDDSRSGDKSNWTDHLDCAGTTERGELPRRIQLLRSAANAPSLCNDGFLLRGKAPEEGLRVILHQCCYP